MRWMTHSRSLPELMEWHRWFAWRPVRLDYDVGESPWAWLETVERSLEIDGWFAAHWSYRSLGQEERTTNMASEFYYKLGATVKDLVTDFSGTITGRVEYLTGCRQYLVAPKMKNETLMEARWFDEDRLQVDGKALVLPTSANDGPDAPAPIK